jgi:formate dehydrogenase major subunit
MSRTQFNPAVDIPNPSEIAGVGSPEFPHVGTTYRVTEHWQSGIMTRNSPWLNELMPNMFAEISTGLAKSINVQNGERVKISTKRGDIVAIACVTERMKPLNIGGRQVEVVGLPWHWGYSAMSTGDSANDLTAHVGDVNTWIPEYKAFVCRVGKVS